MSTTTWVNSIVRLASIDHSNTRFGTGFVIHRDATSTCILTCAHVIAAVGGPELLIIDGHRAQIIASGETVDIDLAIVRVDVPLNKNPVILQASGIAGVPVRMAGFQHVVGREYVIRQIRGKLGRQIGLESRSRSARLDAWDVEVVDDFTLRPGQSGSPIVDERSGAVVGILRIGQGEGERGLAVSVKAVHELWPNLASVFLRQGQSERRYVDWGNAPDVGSFFGRQHELATLRKWLVGDRCRVVNIVGLRGIGKTTLTVALCKGINGRTDLPASLTHGVQDDFELIIWRSLLNAPPLSDVLSDVLGFVSNQQEVSPLSSVEEQLGRLSHYVERHRCLLILDNLESILRSGIDQAGVYRDDYETYGDLVALFGKSTHQSCLLINSREKPVDIALIEGRNRPVRALEINGLARDSGRKVLDEIGSFSGSEANWAELVGTYGGNPLALELAAKHIGEVFFGDISRFLDSGRPVFNDLHDLLDWHLNRLSVQELEAIYWLAIHREPATLSELESSILKPDSRNRLPSTLQSLQRRMPLARASSRFSLQPVLIEHITNRIIDAATADLLAGRSGILQTHALMRALARDYVREAQIRLIVVPVLDSLRTALGGRDEVRNHLSTYTRELQSRSGRKPSYAAGNVMNLLCQLDDVLADRDFSHLDIRQAYLQEVKLHNVNLAHSNVEDSVFMQTFGPISCLALSPDGELVAGSESNGDIHVWRLTNFQVITTLRGHINWVFALAFSPDGRALASGGEDKVVRLWDLETSNCVTELREHANSVWAVAFSPNGRVLATGSEDRTVKVWNLASGTAVATMADHQQKVFCLEFSPDGQKLASASADRTLKIWDIFDWHNPRTLTGHQATIRAVSFSPDSQIVASCSWDRAIKLWNPDTGECIKTLSKHTDPIHSVAFHPNGELLASSGESGTIRIWDVPSAECLTALQGHVGDVWKAAFSNDGQVLVSAGYDGAVRVWDTRDWICRNTMRGYIDWVLALAFHPSGRTIAASNGDFSIRVWDVATGECIERLEAHTGWAFSVAFSPDGGMMATGSDDRSIKLWDTRNWQVIRTLEGHLMWVQAVAFSGDGAMLASGSDDHTVKLWDVATGMELGTLDGHAEGVWALAFAPDGRLLASASEDRTIKLWDVVEGACERTLVGHEDRVHGVSFHPDGDRLVSCSDDKTVRVWDVSTGACLRVLTGHESWVISVTYGATGHSIWSGGKDTLLRVWDSETGHVIGNLHGHSRGIWSVDYNEKQRLVATASEDGAIRVWNAESLRCVNELRQTKPYENSNIHGVSGLTEAQKTSLRVLGAIEVSSTPEPRRRERIAPSITHDYAKYAGEYSTLGFEGTYYLGFRDIPALLEKHVRGDKALDYGCGPGRSTRYLKGLGFDTVGVDISRDMLREAAKQDENGVYRHIQSAQLPFVNNSFDLVFSSFVFIEVSSMEEIARISREIRRVLRPGGRVVMVTSAIAGIEGNWVSFTYDFPENGRNLAGGDIVKLQINGTSVVLYDYYWSDEDFRRIFSDAGLAVVELHKPMGHAEDPIEWRDEARKPYIGIYVLAKSAGGQLEAMT
jgi:WD40 repeat protein/SAM-dependent methyltransferase